MGNDDGATEEDYDIEDDNFGEDDNVKEDGVLTASLPTWGEAAQNF